MIQYNNAQTFLNLTDTSDRNAQDGVLAADSEQMYNYAQVSDLPDTETAAFRVLQECNTDYGQGYPSSQFINSTFVSAQQNGF